MAEDAPKHDLLPFMGLYAKNDKNGNLMLTGRLGVVRVIILKNTRKKEDKHPDFNVLLAKAEPFKPAGQAPAARPAAATAPDDEY